MSKVEKIKRQLGYKEIRLDQLNRQRNIVNKDINELEERRNLAALEDKSKLEFLVKDRNNSLEKIDENIDCINDEIDLIKQELEKSDNNSSNDLSTVYTDEYDLDESNEADSEILKSDDSEDDVDDKESSALFSVGDFGNVNSSYYQSRLEELRKLERVVVETSISSDEPDASKKVSASELIRTEDSIKKTILYVGTFFPKLSNQDFERIVSFSLKWQSKTVTVPSIETSEEEEQIKTISQKKNLYEIWQEEGIFNSDLIMEECYLSSVSLKNHVRVVDFDLTYLRDDFKNYFYGRGSQYLEKQFERSKLLLLDKSIEVARNAVELSVEMAKFSPSVHGGQWLEDIFSLFRLFTNFVQLEKAGLSISEIAQLLFSDEQKWEEFQSFANFLSQVDEAQRGQFLIYRVAFLVERMLKYNNLKSEVDKFLDYEIATQNEETVLALISLLQSVPKFNWLPWAEKLLNKQSKLISFYTRQILFFQLQQSNNNVYKLLTRINHWIPKKKLNEQKNYSQSEIYALRLIYKYSRELSDNLKPRDYGCYPPKYQLFASLDENSTERKLKLIVKWVFDSSHEYFVRNYLQSASQQIAEWFIIICGLDDKKVDTRLLDLADKLLKQVIAEVNFSQQQKLIQYWYEQTSILLNEANKAQKAGKRSFQNHLMQKRYSIMQLVERFITHQN